MNEKAGFFVNNKGLGQYNKIYFEDYFDSEMGVFRDGIQMNNNFFGIFDPEVISINEIQKIELISNISSFIYGINSTGKSVNIITKDIFQPKPFSQLRYSQDRSGSLFADVSFTIPFSRKFNFLLRANNHSLDGIYSNSNFSAWRADGRMSWFPSAKWNFKLDFAYAKISRGLNGGLNFTGKDLGNESIVNSFRDGKAAVHDNLANEEGVHYFPSLSVYSTAFGNNSMAMIQLYYKNYYRDYGGKFFPTDTINAYIHDYYKTRTFGINLRYDKKFISGNSNSVNFSLLNNYYFNYYNPDYQLNDYTRLNADSKANFGFLSGKLDYTSSNFYAAVLAKTEQSFVKENSGNSLSYGGEMKYAIVKNNEITLGIFGGINKIEAMNFYPAYTMYEKTKYTNYQAGTEFNFDKINSSIEYNRTDLSSRINLKADITAGYFNLQTENDFLIKNFENSLPIFSRNDLSYSNRFFKDKLDLKVGLTLRIITNYYYYAQNYLNTINDRIYSGTINPILDSVNFNNKFLADFYIGARIGHANVNFTVANIFNSFYFDTFMFPADDRGGLGGAVSRFTIVWDFIN